jgi:hypothetical protein
VIEDAAGVVRAMMMRTAPHNLVLSPMPEEAIAPAVHAVLERDREIPGVSGSRELAESFRSRFIKESTSPLRFRVDRDVLVYVLGTLITPERATGFWRPGDESDFELLLRWWKAFADDTNVEQHGLEEGLRGSLTHGQVFVWVDDGRAVCAVAHSPMVAVPSGPVVRVGPVYTPPHERRRGYAGHLTAAVSSQLIEQGMRPMLFTDASNPTSNAVYVRLDYEKVNEIVGCSLEPA